MDALKLSTSVDNTTTQYIVIKVGTESYGINISYVETISRMVHITRVPKVAPYIKGVINLRGEVIPVLSLRLKMGLEDDVITKTSRIIILKLEQTGLIGIVVDEVKEVVTLYESQVEKVASDNTADHPAFVSSVGKCENGLVSLLDLNAVVAEKE